jgi:hypothetical protein
MKALATTLMVFILFSCGTHHRNSISGNGKVAKKEVSLNNFSILDVSDNIEVEIIISKDTKAEIEADENIIDHILVEQRGSILSISSDKRIRMARSKKVIVYCNELKEIDASTASNVFSGKPLQIEDLRIDAKSAANIELSGEFTNLDINGSSSADITLNGTTKSLSVNLSSAADLNAFELKADKAVVNVSSASDARIRVSNEAHLRASSAADIVYKGSPEIIDSKSSSAGDIKKSGN